MPPDRSRDPDELRREFAERLKAAVTHAELQFPHRDLAASLGVSKQSVQKWLSGQALPREQHLQRLAERLGVRSAWLRDADPPAYPDHLRADQTPTALRVSDEELRWIVALRRISEEQRHALWTLLSALPARTDPD